LKKQISKIGLDSSVVISINTPPYLIEEHCDVLLAELMKHSNTIELEILETSSIIDFDKYNRNIRQLKSELSNLRVTLDDYGKEFASLERLLKGESIDGVKIDRELFLELAKNNHKVGFYEKWLGFIKLFDVDITIEGVENEQEYEMAVCLGADYIQGYYTGRPRCLI
jgi:EAL domain-containing protein (putative c-di-GMP-specific phosphodiesterase class I)